MSLQKKMVEIERCGIILNVARFDECVRFYTSLFGLPEMFTKIDGNFRLTCLEFCSAYLMIENGDIASTSEKAFSQNSTILRFNVIDINKAFEAIVQYDGNARLIQTDWGAIVRCMDRDGNPVSVRESAGFKAT